LKDDFIFLFRLFELKAKVKMRTIVCIIFLCNTFMSVGYATDIVVNPSVPIYKVSLNKTRAIFTMRQLFWPNGEKIKVFTLVDNHPLHQKFTKNNLHMFPHQLRRVWDRITFSGIGRVPVVVSSEEEMLEKVANTPNAIGYLSSEFKNEKVRLFISQ